MSDAPPLYSDRLESASRFAAVAHQGQVRRSSETPYFQHVAAVAGILERAGFAEDVVIAGLLHDVVEDTPTTLDEVSRSFGPEVARLVGFCSEVKLDASGRKRPWIDRKTDHLAALADAPVEARAVILADKLHNLAAIAHDLARGVDVWAAFHADREQVLWYYEASLRVCGEGDPRLERLALACRAVLESLD
ncbi:HD domain-containing protein [Planctomyces sp. SH-PL62]|uniref:HD domain-containing protein n=1 Tax=Planctomyces sp. SH-PL62 TaxID=1636152 RepID=UPI00078D8A2D|nr:HD domain-containing protein [Planctomyces sp. SH-PL62]AMV36425.1 GTP pyrophosphokinase [Planctomyces sp. SH-PL62]